MRYFWSLMGLCLWGATAALAQPIPITMDSLYYYNFQDNDSLMQGDAPNVTDSQGLRQGLWELPADGSCHDPYFWSHVKGYDPNAVKLRGYYQDGQLTGPWIKYDTSVAASRATEYFFIEQGYCRDHIWYFPHEGAYYHNYISATHDSVFTRHIANCCGSYHLVIPAEPVPPMTLEQLQAKNWVALLQQGDYQCWDVFFRTESYNPEKPLGQRCTCKEFKKQTCRYK